MKSNLKKKLIAVLLTIFSVCILCVACGKTTVTVTLDKQTAELEVGGSPVTLTATTSDGSEVIWQTSNADVATVKNGVVTPVSEGSATIKAVSGESSGSCYVTVVDNRPYYLQTTVSGVSVSTLNLRRGDERTIQVKLCKGDNTYPSDFEFTSSNPEVASVENGVITAKTKGDTIVSFSTLYNGQTYSGSINVCVAVSLMLDIDNSPVNLSTLDGADYSVSKTIAAAAYEGENLVTDAVLIWYSSDETVATVSNGVITAVGKGKTNVSVSCEYAGERVSVDIEVNVHLKCQEVEKNFIFSLYDQTSFDVNLGVSLDTTLKNVVFSNDDNTFTANALSVPRSAIEKSGYYTVTVETEKTAYVCEAVVADKIIKTADELARWPYFVRPANWSRTTGGHIYDGIILLGDDIDFSGYTTRYFNELFTPNATNTFSSHADTCFEVNADGSTKLYGSSNGPADTCLKVEAYSADFVGTFDGMGHTVYNVSGMNLAESGLFGTVCSGTIKNIAFVNLVGNCNTYSGILCKNFNGTAENIFVEGGFAFRLGQDVGLLFSNVSKLASLSKITGILNYGYGGASQNSKASTIGVIAGLVAKDTAIDNVYALGLEAYVYQDVRAYDDINDFKEDKDDLSDFGTYWNTDKGFPIFDSALKIWKNNGSEFELSAIDDNGNSVKTVIIGKSVKIKVTDRTITAREGVYYGLGSQLVYNTLSVEPSSVTLEDKVLSVPTTVPAETSITVTATNIFTGVKTTLTLLAVYESVDETILLSAYDTETNYVINSSAISGTVTAITFVNSADGSIIKKDSTTVAKADLPVGYYEAIVTTDNGGIVINVIVADKVIMNAAEFANWPYYIRPSTWSYAAGLDAANTSGKITSNVYTGVIVLGADIDMNGAEYFNELMYNINGVSVGVKKDGTITSEVEDDENFPVHPKWGIRTNVLQSGYCAEFAGTLDGMGHTVYNFHIDKPYAGIFGFRIASTGVVKDVGFTQVTLNYPGDGSNNTFKYQTSALAGYLYGSAYNIFVEGAMNFVNSGQTRNQLIFGDIQYKAAAENLVGVVTYTPSGDSGNTSRVSVTGYGDVTGGINVGLVSGTTVAPQGNYPVVNDLIADFNGKYAPNGIAAISFSSLNSDLWDISSGFPIFKSAIGKLSTLNLEVVNNEEAVTKTVSTEEVVTIRSVALSAGGVNSQMNYWTFEVDGNAALDTTDVLNGVKLTVDSGVANGTVITVTATNQFDSTQKVTIVLTVA